MNTGNKVCGNGKWKRLGTLLLVVCLLLSGKTTAAFADMPGIGSRSGAAGGLGFETMSAQPALPEGVSYPTGDMIYDEREISGEEIPADIPIYGSYSVFSLEQAERDAALDAPKERYGYQHLPEKLKGFYDACWTAILNFRQNGFNTTDYIEEKDTVALCGVDFGSFGLSSSEACAVYYCIRNDFPEYFWLYSGLRYSSDGILYVLLNRDYFTKEARQRDQQALIDGTKAYVDAAKNASDTYEKVRIVHDKLIRDVEYAWNSKGQPEDALWAHSVMGVFNGKNAVVCEGYAKTLQLVLGALGIENVYIVGTAGGGGHAWNAVKINGEWLLIDVTWDDAGADFAGDGLLYLYFCIPASVFNNSHKANKSTTVGSSWLYELPAMSNSDQYTFYSKYSCDFTKISSKADAETQLCMAGRLVPGQYIHALAGRTTASYVMAASGVNNYISAPDGNGVVIIDAAQYKVKNPATGITLSETALEIDRDQSKTASLTAVLTAAGGTCDDVVRWSASSNCVLVTPGQDGRSAVITGKRNGTAVITATAAAGGVSKTCTVTVTGTAEYENIYLDAAFTVTPEEKDFTVWVNGGNVGSSKETKYNYKVRSLYTDIKASKITTTDSKGRTKTKNGKLVAGITLSSEEPELVKGKIVDKEAAKTAKATVNAKTGLIKVTAQKVPGEVYLWVIDTGNAHSVAYAKITVTAAPSKLLVNDGDYSAEGREPVKKQTLSIGESVQVYLEPLLASKGTEIAEGGSYSVTYSKNGENYVDVTPVAGSKYGFNITPVALDTAKAGKTLNVRVNFVCNENNKKASVSITITNPMESIEFTAGTGLETEGEDAFLAKYSETQAQSLTLNFDAQPVDPSLATTDKPKVLAVTGEEGIHIDEKGRLKVTRPAGDAAKIKASLSRDKKSIIVKVPKKLAVGTKTYFVLYYNKDCYKVCSVEVAE